MSMLKWKFHHLFPQFDQLFYIVFKMTRGRRCLFIKEAVIFSVICQEKTIQNIEGFDKQNLKHAETEVKNPLPDNQGLFSSHCFHNYMQEWQSFSDCSGWWMFFI